MVILMRKLGNPKGQNWVNSTVCMRDGGDSSAEIIRIITLRKGVKNKKVKYGRNE